MSNGRGALSAVLALFGIVLAAGLTWSVVRLSGEHIGLASAPISVVRGLAPGPAAGGVAPPEHDVTRTVTTTVTASRTVTEAASTSGTATTRPATSTTATSAVTIAPPPATRTNPDRSGDGRERSRSGSGGGRDD